MVRKYLQSNQNAHPMFVSNRAKQWLVFLQMHYQQAGDLFHQIKRLTEANDVFCVIDKYLEQPDL